MDESKLGHACVEQFALLVEDFVEEVDAGSRALAQRESHGQQFVEEGRFVVLRLYLQNRHHDPALLDLGKRHTQFAHKLAAGSLVVADVIRMVANAHLVGMFVPDPYLTVGSNHRFRFIVFLNFNLSIGN